MDECRGGSGCAVCGGFLDSLVYADTTPSLFTNSIALTRHPKFRPSSISNRPAQLTTRPAAARSAFLWAIVHQNFSSVIYRMTARIFLLQTCGKADIFRRASPDVSQASGYNKKCRMSQTFRPTHPHLQSNQRSIHNLRCRWHVVLITPHRDGKFF